MGSKKNFAIGAAIAAIGGYVAGILTAPKSGKETRQDIKNSAVKAKTDAEKKLKELNSELNAMIETGKEKAKNLKSSAKKEMDLAIEGAQKAKESARQALTAIHEGGMDDEDLQKAVEDIKKAKDHLKNYIGKVGDATKSS